MYFVRSRPDLPCLNTPECTFGASWHSNLELVHCFFGMCELLKLIILHNSFIFNLVVHLKGCCINSFEVVNLSFIRFVEFRLFLWQAYLFTYFCTLFFLTVLLKTLCNVNVLRVGKHYHNIPQCNLLVWIKTISISISIFIAFPYKSKFVLLFLTVYFCSGSTQ